MILWKQVINTTYKQIKEHKTHLAANKTPEKKQQYLYEAINHI